MSCAAGGVARTAESGIVAGPGGAPPGAGPQFPERRGLLRPVIIDGLAGPPISGVVPPDSTMRAIGLPVAQEGTGPAVVQKPAWDSVTSPVTPQG